MADNPNLRGPEDAQRINVSQEHEISHWSQKLGVSPEQLRDAVTAVGPMAEDVEQYFRRGNATGHWREKSVG